MRNRLVLATAAALTSASLLASASGSGSTPGDAAQSVQDRSAVGPNIVLAQATTDPKNQPKKPPPQPPVRAVTPPARVIAPTVAPKVVAPVVAPKIVAPVTAPKFVAPTGPKVVSPTTNNPVFVPRSSGQRAVGPGGAGPRGNAARALAIRGANNTAIAGRNFSVRRGSYRAYRGGYWRTFVGVGTLGAILYGGYRYYPYAYIDAPPDLCEGETEDGCQLQWQEVQTLEGPPDFQCVAYCPWQ